MSKYAWRLIEKNGIIRETMRQVDQQQVDFLSQENQYYETFDEKIDVDDFTEDPADDSGEDEILLSDIIADAILCHGMKDVYHRYGDQCVNVPNEEIQLLADYNSLVKEYVYCRKSVLRRIHEAEELDSDRKPNRYWKKQDQEYTRNLDLISTLINDCRKNVFSEERWEDYESLFQSSELGWILRQIRMQWVDGRVPYYWLEKLVITFDETFAERRKLIRLLYDSVPYQPKKNSPLTIQMVMNDAVYFAHIKKAKAIHIANTEEMLNSYFPGAEISIQDFLGAIGKMREYVNRYKKENPEERVFVAHCDEGGACYGLLQHGDTEYFALSGSFDYVEERIKDLCGFSQEEIGEYDILKKNVEQLQKTCFPDAVWARMCLATMRYPNSKNKASRIPDDGESFDEALNRIPAESSKNYAQYMKDLKYDFKCCERKIFEYVSWDKEEIAILFSKFRPCEMCRKAIRKAEEENHDICVIYLGEKCLVKWIDTKDEDVEGQLGKEYGKTKKKLPGSVLELMEGD